jgi:RNA polymerase sigma-B factor
VLSVLAVGPVIVQILIAVASTDVNARPGARPESDEERRRRAEFVTLRRTKDRELRRRLIEANLPLAWFVARRFVKRGEPPEDLRQVAMVALILAVDRYDPDRGPGFAAYATPTIAGELKRYLRDNSWRWHVPRPLSELSVVLVQLVDRLSQARGRSPTIGELADHSGASRDEVAEALTYSNLYEPLHHTDDGGRVELSLEERLGADDSPVDRVDMRSSAEPLLRQLPRWERTLLYLRFFQGLTQHEIAERMGVSQMHVSRLLARTLGGLRAKLQDRGRGA